MLSNQESEPGAQTIELREATRAHELARWVNRYAKVRTTAPCLGVRLRISFCCLHFQETLCRIWVHPLQFISHACIEQGERI